MLPIDLASKFDLIDDHWHPRVVASLNGQDVKIAKVQGKNPNLVPLGQKHRLEEAQERALVVQESLLNPDYLQVIFDISSMDSTQNCISGSEPSRPCKAQS